MELFINGKLNSQAFEMDVRQGTHELNDILLAAARLQSAAIESTHFLIALGHIPAGTTRKDLERNSLTPDQWEEGLSACIVSAPGTLPPDQLSPEYFTPPALAMLDQAGELCTRYKFNRINEAVLLLCALSHLSPAVSELFADARIDAEDWRKRTERLIRPVEKLDLYDQNGALQLKYFSPGAKKALTLMHSEAESFGYDLVDPRHLLLAFLEREGQVTQYGLHHQGLSPKKIQEIVSLNLHSRSRSTRSQIPLDMAHIQPVLRQILARAADLAGRDGVELVSEAILLKAFLETESSALRILRDERANIAELVNTAETYDPGGEEEDDSAIADIETVRQRLKARLVGQDDAIERVLPYVQRMRFGFRVPGKPVGVFLFCGQSGSGKTEMAKELARAVYGSEEKLIFLEMGQFNSPESMNIFVGAPPGYIGYGEGKLTNGLRDKPQSVVLFDEVEKAKAPGVLDALLRFLDEGKIDDPAGPVRDGSQCILILTSNVGAEKLSQLWKEIGDDPNWRALVRNRLREEFKNANFRVEFLNRVDELILFKTLTEENYIEIAERLLKRDLGRLAKERQIEIIPNKNVAFKIGAYCAAVNEGARAAHRLVQSIVITPVIDFIVRNDPARPVKLKVWAESRPGDPTQEPVGKVDFA